MLPLEPLAAISPVERLILRARAPEVAAEIARLERMARDGAMSTTAVYDGAPGTPTEPAEVPITAPMRAAITFARGSLALREGSLGPALADFEAAAAELAALGEVEAAELARA